MSHFEDKLNRAHDELKRKGVWAWNYNPPLARLLRRLGFEYRPPYYNRFFVNVLTQGPAFGLVWGVLMWFTAWREEGMPIAGAVVVSLLAGLLFGLLMASHYKRKSSKLGLSEWDALT